MAPVAVDGEGLAVQNCRAVLVDAHTSLEERCVQRPTTLPGKPMVGPGTICNNSDLDTSLGGGNEGVGDFVVGYEVGSCQVDVVAGFVKSCQKRMFEDGRLLTTPTGSSHNTY